MSTTVFNTLETRQNSRVSQVYNYRFSMKFHSCNDMSGFPGALVCELAGGPRVVMYHRNEAGVTTIYRAMWLVRLIQARLLG